MPRHLFYNGVAFRMDGRIIKRLVTVANSQKSGCLLKGLAAQFGDVQQLFSFRKRPIAIAMFDDSFRQCWPNAGDVGQQGRTGHINVDTDTIYTRFHDVVQRLLQLRLIDVVLILPDADGLGIDFDQFRQRVLQSVSNADCPANGDIQFRIFADCQFTGRVHRGARFADDDLCYLQVVAGQQISDKRIRLS